MSSLILSTSGLTKEFKGFTAVNELALNVAEGSIHGLIGPNGAGKSTVFNLLTKFHTPTRGSIALRGTNITHCRPAEVARMGIVRSFQISAIFQSLTVRDNIRVALQRPRGLTWQFWRSLSLLGRLDERVEELLDLVGLARYADNLAGELSYGRKRALELATTMALDPQLMLLDEPLAGMAHEDIAVIEALIRRLGRRCTILMVEHNLNVVSSLCDVVTVLQRGEMLTQGPYAEVSANPQVREAYIGVEDD